MRLEDFKTPEGELDIPSIRERSRKFFQELEKALEETHGNISDEMDDFFKDLADKEVA